MERIYEESRADFISKVMTHMGIGLLITFVAAYLTSTSDALQAMVNGRYGFLGLVLIEFLLVIYLTRRINSMSLTGARIGFAVYALVNGLTLSSIFMLYTEASLFYVFLIASATFIGAGLFGIATKRDMSAIGHFLLLSLIGIVIISIANIFLRLPILETGISAVGVLIFTGLTAYDMQKLKKLHYGCYTMDSDTASKYAIIGALELYLDFINIFLYLLRLFGRRR
jgi:FtsH-binding integral membrane protein